MPQQNILIMKQLLLIVSILLSLQLTAQVNPTPADAVQKGLALKSEMKEKSLLKNLRFTNIGPTVMSGRVVDVEVNPNNPVEF